MKMKILGIAVAVLTIVMLAAPVLAIGPQNAAEKNPNYASTPVSFDILLPIHGIAHGMVHEWVVIAPVSALNKDPRAFELKSAYVVNSPYEIMQMENKWLYVSPSILHDFYVLKGTPPQLIDFILVNHPDGIYYKWHYEEAIK